MKSTMINLSNFVAAICAFVAASLWILSGGLGEVNLVISEGDKADAVARGAAKFNTSAAWWALFSSVFVMISSVISILIKDDHVRKEEEEKREAEENARLEKIISDYQEEKSRAARSNCFSDSSRDNDNSSLTSKNLSKRRINPYPFCSWYCCLFFFLTLTTSIEAWQGF